VTRQTTQFSQETNKLVSSLNDTAAEMRRSIADFKLSDDDIPKKKINGYRSI
jgi:twitching motility protein PilJ